MGELFFIVSLIVFLILPFLFLQGSGRVFWIITMGIIGLTVVTSELVSKLVTGHTISQHFWAWSLNHPSTAWLVIGLLAFGWGSLLLHLSWKLITGNKK